MSTGIALIRHVASSRALLRRAAFLCSAIILVGNGIFSIFHLPQKTLKSVCLSNLPQSAVTNQTMNSTVRADFWPEAAHPASRVDENSRFIHRLYWNIVRRNQSNNTVHHVLNSESDRGVLKSIYDSGALWGQYRTQETAGSGLYDLPAKYDSQLIMQQVWQETALDVYPDFFRSNASKKIVIRDGFRWWGYIGGENLTCTGAFDHRCTLSERDEDVRDAAAVIAVRDWFHKFSDFDVSNNDTFRIFFIQESPIVTPETELSRRNDLLASYWRGSELPARYANWVYYNPHVRSKPQGRNYAKGKMKLAAIFMSHCVTRNKRRDIVRALKRHMQVDVYGNCGDHICKREKQNLCFEKLRKEYFFYLAFENANCRDYVTEKLFVNALQNDVVPVVLGAHPNDYKSLAPEQSFIMVDDFDSVAQLATHLKQIASDEKAYNKYFGWKDTGEFIHSDFFCRACSLLWYADINPVPPRRTAFRWAGDTDGESPMCLTPGEQLWRRRMKDIVS